MGGPKLISRTAAPLYSYYRSVLDLANSPGAIDWNSGAAPIRPPGDRPTCLVSQNPSKTLRVSDPPLRSAAFGALSFLPHWLAPRVAPRLTDHARGLPLGPRIPRAVLGALSSLGRSICQLRGHATPARHVFCHLPSRALTTCSQVLSPGSPRDREEFYPREMSLPRSPPG